MRLAEHCAMGGARDTQPMQSLIDAALDEILCAWHQHFRDSVGRGFNRCSVGFDKYRTSRQYDDTNGALDARLEHDRMESVEFHVCQMRDPHKAAIYAQARALVLGIHVFNSPRLPLDREERAIVISDARAMLVRRLQDAGVM